ncbi:MAG TPA: prepilin-type N-terminal cleavage/methylation domain-containing protein [Oligoflexia bacterium]|nr:prepilin-type N-terminal cleavage/methylation domain-containing protein [Oligoflexia bacterium]HMP47934.1 prepilin-type N-terminal cleavage/methylation domain-containing protein [Oligoflexia bacterium]
MNYISKNSNHFNQSGFTLAELMVVVVLLSILGVSILQVVNQIQASTQTAETLQRGLEQSHRAFGIIRSRLRSKGNSPLPPMRGNNQFNNQSVSAGQPSFGYRSFMVHNIQGSNSSNSILRFITQASSLASPSQRSFYGEIEARFYIDTSITDTPLVMELWDILPASIASGRNIQQSSSISNEPLRRILLLRKVEHFGIRKRLNQAWDTNWDNPYAPEPKLIEITIVHRDNPGNSPEVFRGVVPLGITG